VVASPQKENGFTPIANEIMDKLCLLKLSGSEWQIILFVFRKTYGWHKKEDEISITQFEKNTNLSRQAVCEDLKSVVNRRLLVVNKTGLSNRYKFNKNWEEWVVNKNIPSQQKRTIGSQQKHKKVVNKNIHTIDTLTKEKIKDNNTKVLVAKPQYGNEDLNNLIEFGKQNTFPLQGSIKFNRYSAFNLIKKIGLEKSKQLVMAAVKCRGTPYAPVINDFGQLYKKIGDLVSFYSKNNIKKGKNYDK
jgi:phage replication O-like protein O